MSIKLGRVLKFPGGQVVQVPFASNSRLNISATGTSTAQQALPTGAKVIIVRATEPVWLRFGADGVGAAAANSDSLLFPPGESVMPVPYSAEEVFSTHVRALQVGANPSTVQIEAIPHVEL